MELRQVSEFVPLNQSDIIRELLRLNSEQAIARQSGDQDSIEAADQALAHFLRLNAQGRVKEHFDARAQAARNDQ